jgi:hypothetical protein
MNSFTLLPLADLAPQLVPLGGLLLSIIAIIVPFAFVATIVAIAMFNSRKKTQLHHETIRLALEKGQPLPAELLNMPSNAEKKPKPNDRREGLILIATGAAFYFLLSAVGSATGKPLLQSARWAGLLPGLIGVAMLINWFFDRREKSNDKTQA